MKSLAVVIALGTTTALSWTAGFWIGKAEMRGRYEVALQNAQDANSKIAKKAMDATTAANKALETAQRSIADIAVQSYKLGIIEGLSSLEVCGLLTAKPTDKDQALHNAEEVARIEKEIGFTPSCEKEDFVSNLFEKRQPAVRDIFKAQP